MPNFVKLGRITMSVAKESGLECADVYVSGKYLTHITIGHKAQIEKLGFTVIDYLMYIVKNYNQIRIGKGASYLLVKYNDELHDVAAVDLNYSVEKNFWEVKTAQPRNTRKLKSFELVWCKQKKRS